MLDKAGAAIDVIRTEMQKAAREEGVELDPFYVNLLVALDDIVQHVEALDKATATLFDRAMKAARDAKPG
jgi:hypothetical protein